jgi:hypothetical protein
MLVYYKKKHMAMHQIIQVKVKKHIMYIAFDKYMFNITLLYLFHQHEATAREYATSDLVLSQSYFYFLTLLSSIPITT